MKKLLVLIIVSGWLLSCEKVITQPAAVILTHEIMFTVSGNSYVNWGINEYSDNFTYHVTAFENTLTVKENDTLFINVKLTDQWVEYEIFEIIKDDIVWKASGGGKGFLTTFVVK